MYKTTKAAKAVLSVIVFILFASVNSAGAVDDASKIKIDNKCDEWKDIKPLAEDPKGDVSNNDVVDYLDFSAVRGSDSLYISYACVNPMDWNTNAWRYNVFINTDDNLTTGYKGYDGSWHIGADYLVQGGKLFKFTGTGPMAWEWKEIESLSYSVEGARAEVKVPYNSLEIKPGQKIEILLHGDNANTVDFVPDDYKTKVIIIK